MSLQEKEKNKVNKTITIARMEKNVQNCKQKIFELKKFNFFKIYVK